MKALYVYAVSRRLDKWGDDDYDIAHTSTLPLAKREAQSDYTRRELPDAAPTLKWDRREYEHGATMIRYWISNEDKYGHRYDIHKVKVTTS